MGEIAFELLCMHRTLRLDKITQCWVSDGGWMLETVPRGDGQRENLVHPKTVPPGKTKPDQRCYGKDGQQQPYLSARIYSLRSPVFSGATSSGVSAVAQRRRRPSSRYGPMPKAHLSHNPSEHLPVAASDTHKSKGRCAHLRRAVDP